MTDTATASSDAVSTTKSRIATLDILRGVAVMGILAMNVVGFAMPFQAYFNPLAYGGSPADLAIWLFDFVFIDGKMRGFFSFLFGASMLIVIDRAKAAGLSAGEIHYRRMAWLFAIGMAHMVLIWWGDILAHYALVGMIAWFFRDMTPKTLIRWGLVLVLANMLIMGLNALGFAYMEQAASAPGASRQAIRTWQDASFGFAILSPADLAADLARYRGDYGGIFTHRFSQAASAPAFQLIFGGAETLGYMLLGMAGLRSRFLTGEWDPARYRKVALAMLAVSVPAYAALGWLIYRSGFSVPLLFGTVFALTAPFRIMMIVGYAAFIVLLTRSGGALVDRVAVAGRMALSNYLGTSLVMTTLFYGYGFGLYGALDRAQLWLVVIAMWLLMLLWSRPWLDRFRYGPFEWLWRSLARGEAQPLRKPGQAA